MEWQPIETAPKDGTEIIGFWPSYRKGRQVQVTYYVDTETREYGKIERVSQYWMSPSPWTVGERTAPTHWMPIPEAPIMQQAEEVA
jgi:hypothetical protein